MATVRSPSSLAARKMRMAISLRLAARTFLIGCNLVARGLMRDATPLPDAIALRESYIVSRTRREAPENFSMEANGFLPHVLASRVLRLFGSSLGCSRGAAHRRGCRRSILELLQLRLHRGPQLGLGFRGIRRIGLAVKIQQFGAHVGRRSSKIIFG